MTRRRHPASAFRLRRVDLSKLGDQKVQPLEILVVDTLSELCPEVDWKATQVQGDGGVDFLGVGRAIRLPVKTKDIFFRHSIVGQVKRSSRYRMELLSATFTGVHRRVRETDFFVSQFLFVISSTGKAIARFSAEAPGICELSFPGVPVSVLDATDFVWLWAQADEQRFEVLRPAYSEEEFAFLNGYLSTLAIELRSPVVEVEISTPSGRAVAGADIDLTLTLRAPGLLPGEHLGVTIQPDPEVDLVRPLALLSSLAQVKLDDHGLARIALRFRPRTGGKLSLGSIQVFRHSSGAQAGPPILTQTLAAIDIAPDASFQHVRFHQKPHSAPARALDRISAAAASRGVEIVAVLGPGGIGKSRLIDELFNSLHIEMESNGRQLWSLARVDHETYRGPGGRFLRDTLFGLAFPDAPAGDARFANPEAAVAEWLGRYVGAQREMVRNGLDAIAQPDGNASAEPAAFLLLMVLIARLRDGPVALHLANMHWSDAFEIDVLLELIHRLAMLDGQLPNGVLLILEGREGEMIEAQGDSNLTTEAWRRLHAAGDRFSRIRLEPWPEHESRQFVEGIIESLAGRPLSDQRLQSKIAAHVLNSSLGNPMQMIEHLRILCDNGWLRVETDGSAVFDAPSQLPHSLVELIAARVEFINRSPRNGEATALLRLCAEIGLRVEADIFGPMANALSDSRLLGTLLDWRVARLSGNGGRDFEFLHEAYREAFLRIGWRGSVGESIRQAALARLGTGRDRPVDQVIAAAKLRKLDPGCDLAAVAEELEQALASSSAPQARISLCRELLMLPRDVLERGAGWFRLVRTLADLLILHGDWQEALRTIERARQVLNAQDRPGPIEIAELAYRSGNLLGDLHRMREGLSEVRAGLSALKLQSSAAGAAIVTQELLDNRLGILLWFSGRPDEGVAHLQRAYRSARRLDRGGQRELLFSCEIGMVMACRYPGRALKLLDRATQLFEAIPDCDPSLDYARVQRDMVRLLMARTSQNIEAVRDQLSPFVADTSNRSVYAETLGWLTLGACEFALGRREAAKAHFGEAIAGAARCRNLRLTWKAHLAYATVASEPGKQSSESSHARYAGRLLLESLDNVEAEHRRAWADAIRLPLEHARRLCGEDAALDRGIATIDGGSPPCWLADWASRPSATSARGCPFQILHVRSGADDIFVMG